MSELSPKNKSVFDSLSGQTCYWLGLATGVIAFFVIGFFVLLSMVTGGGESWFNFDISKKADEVVDDSVPTNDQQLPEVATIPPTVTEGDYALGPDDAKVTIIEFSDIQCPYCKRLHPDLVKIAEEYPNDVRWVFKHFPLSFHQEALPAALATECVGEQLGDSGYFDYLSALYENQTLLSSDLYLSEAKKLGVNEANFTSCIESNKYGDKINADYQMGVQAGVSGTPGSFVNGQAVEGAQPYEMWKSIIESILNG
ncbi:MAG: hypothetical protein ACD_76C00154G0009 [uncultured bacterium]|nr:MAG: hypothetical protein ACD_76C00154G0009 [uncultured bacterium]HBD05483.1 hypothetical protein [Candidatus Uhrbacteria bacterium]